MTKGISEKELEFLDHSNRIEREYSKEGLEDAIKAWNYALKNKNKICLSYILSIHKRLMKRVYSEIAGKLRDCGICIGGRVCERKPKQELEKELEDWIDSCEYIKEEENVEEQIKQWHVAFEYIHPFRDGNGRVGRILMNIHRVNHALPIMIIHEGKEQFRYYKWF